MANKIDIVPGLEEIFKAFLKATQNNVPNKILAEKYGALYSAWKFDKYLIITKGENMGRWKESFRFIDLKIKCFGGLEHSGTVNSCVFNDIRSTFYTLTCILYIGLDVGHNERSTVINQLVGKYKTVLNTFHKIVANRDCITKFLADEQHVYFQKDGKLRVATYAQFLL